MPFADRLYDEPAAARRSAQRTQPSIAKIEKRTDMYISTLRSHIEAMAGKLEIVARFPEGTVRISNFSELSGKGRG